MKHKPAAAIKLLPERERISRPQTLTPTNFPARDQTETMSKGKGKAIPLQVWRGPEGSRRLRLLDFKTIGA
jgi:hypothetical protein